MTGGGSYASPDAVASVAVLCDVHGNLPALRAVLAVLEERRPERIVIGGDAISGPFPGETLALLERLGPHVRFVRGNADRSAIEAFDGAPAHPMDAFAASQLDRDARDRIAAWPLAQVLHVEGLGRVRVCHATPSSDTEIITARTPARRMRQAFASVAEAIVVVGHTHMPLDRRVESVRVLNAGSVGMPYGRRGAHWLWLGPGVERVRTAYDYRAAAREIAERSGWPEASAFAQGNVLRPPGRAHALAYFETVARDRMPGG